MTFKIETVFLDESESPYDRAFAHVFDRTKNMKEFGEGLFARVFSNDTIDYVVKIFQAKDNGYLSYLNVIANLGDDNPYLPKIHRAIHYRRHDHVYGASDKPGYTSTDYVVVYMEKLEKFQNTHDDDFHALDANEKYKLTCKIRRLEKFTHRLREKLNAIVDGEKVDLSKYRKSHQDMIVLLDIARESAGQNWYDLHCGNIMRRGKRLVITDPICGTD